MQAKTNYGRTPLHRASLNGKLETAILLLEHGADVSAEDNFGQTSENFANSASHFFLAVILKAEAVIRAKCLAFAMGKQERLGAGSWVQVLTSGVVRMIVRQV